MVTPMNDTGTVNYSNFEYLLRMQESAGNGVVILGSTGESLNLTPAERRQIVAFTTKLNLNIPIMVGVGGCELSSTLDWLNYLETQAVDAYLMVTPIYAKPGSEGQFHWFSTLLEAVSRPCMLYNVPSRSGTALDRKAVRRLSEHPNFWAIKEASGSTQEFVMYTHSANGAPVFSGDDAMMWEFGALGCAGVVSVASNIWPRETRLFTRMAIEQALTSEEINLWRDASNALFIASNPIPVKTLLMMEGIIDSNTVKLPLHADDLTNVETLRRASHRVQEWYKKCVREKAA